MLENVEGFKRMREGKMFNQVLAKLRGIKDEGQQAYDIHEKVLNSMDFGVPSLDRYYSSWEYDGASKQEGFSGRSQLLKSTLIPSLILCL